MSDAQPHPSRDFLWRGFLLTVFGLGVLLGSAFTLPDNAVGRNDVRTWLPVIGIFAGLGVGLVGAGLLVLGIVKRFREPRAPRDPNLKRPTKWQAMAIAGASVLLGLSSCGVFAVSLESNSNFAMLLVLGGAGFFVLSGVVFLYAVVIFILRLRGR